MPSEPTSSLCSAQARTGWATLLLSLLCSCSAVFDLAAVEVELVDVRRDINALWHVPEGSSPWISAPLSLAFYADDSSARDYYLPPDDPLWPYIQGFDGQLYFPLTRRNSGAFQYQLYRIPAGDLASQYALPWSVDRVLAQSAPPVLLTLEAAMRPAVDRRAVLQRFGSTPLVEWVAAERWVANPSELGAVLSWEQEERPRTLQIIRHVPPDQLRRTEHRFPDEVLSQPQKFRQRFLYSATIDSVFYYGRDSHLFALSIEDDRTIDLGERTLVTTLPGLIVLSDRSKQLSVYVIEQAQRFELGRATATSIEAALSADRRWLLLCGEEGLLSIPLSSLSAGTTGQTLDERRCDRIASSAPLYVDYFVGQRSIDQGSYSNPSRDPGLLQFRARLDGSEAPERLPGALPLQPQPFELATCHNGLRAYAMNRRMSSEPASSDAWVSGWRFSEDAGEVRFSGDCRRVRWIEHPQDGGLGELFSAEIGRGPRLRLGRSVRQFYELSDGRVLTLANRSGDAAGARLLLIDDAARQAYWLLDQSEPIYRLRHMAAQNELLLQSQHLPLGSTSPLQRLSRLPLPPVLTSSR